MSLSNTHSNVCQCSSNYNNTDSCYVNLRFAGSNMAMSWVGFGSFYLLLAGLIIGALRSCNGGISSSSYSRSSGISDDMPLNSDVFALRPGYNSPQQVHITQGDNEGRGVIVSWVTPNEPGSSEVIYWAENILSLKNMRWEQLSPTSTTITAHRTSIIAPSRILK
ncbi:putative Acid phosphatase [Helianthus annuus]|nr:putative Acid phosphatase [Helianthus annuus]